MVEEKPETEEDYLDQQIEDMCLEFMKYPKSIAVGISDFDGEIIMSPLKGYGPKKFARILAPLTKRCMTVAKCLEPLAKPLSYSIWTRRMTYTVILDSDFFGFAVQQAIRLPSIPPKPMEEISETERNEKRDKEIRIIKRLREDKAKAKAEAEKKAKDLEEKKKRMKALARLKKMEKAAPQAEKKAAVAEAREEGESPKASDEEKEEGEDEEGDEEPGEDQEYTEERAEDEEKEGGGDQEGEGEN